MTDASFGTQFLPLPALIVLLALALPAVVVLYRRDLRTLGGPAGRVLLAMRLLLVALLLVLAADPVYRRREIVSDPGTLLVVVDTSGSSALRDTHRDRATALSEAAALGLVEEPQATDQGGAGGVSGGRPGGDEAPPGAGAAAAIAAVSDATRLELMKLALDSSAMKALTDRFRTVFFGLTDSLRPLTDPATGRLVIPPPGGSTDLGTPIATEVLARARENLAGVLLFSDGNHHAADDPREALAILREVGVPLVSVGVGALEKPKDLSVVGIDATGKTFAGDEVRAQVVVGAAGFPALELPLRIEEEGKTIAEFVAPIPAGESEVRLPVSFPAGEPGRKKITVSLPVQPGETETANNRQELWIEVLSSKARVLYLDGSPRWEWRYLRETWRRDENIDLQIGLVSPSPQQRLPEEFPRTREELFLFDVLVLGDVPPHVFSRAQKESLRDFVTGQGGTLVLIAGPRYLPYAWLDTPLVEILPVEPLEPVPAADLGASIARDGVRLALTRAGETSVITRLVPGLERNDELWELLPAHDWVSPIAGVASGAEVLVTVSKDAMRHLPGADLIEETGPGGDRVREEFLRARGAVLVTHSHGAGRVLYTGIDSTWRWRYRLGDELYARFWGQVVRWAVSERLSIADSYVRLGTNELLYSDDASITIDALIRDAEGRAFEGDTVTAVISGAGNEQPVFLPLEPIPRSSGRFRASLNVADLPRADGPEGSAEDDREPHLAEYRVHLEIPTLPGYAQVADKATAPFVVRPPLDRERQDTVCDVGLLEAISNITGGAFLPLSRLREVGSLVQERPREREVVLTTAAWDFPLAIAGILTALFLAEWVLRKWRDLV